MNDLRMKFFGIARLVGVREQLDANKRPTGKLFCSFSYEGGMMEAQLEASVMNNVKEDGLCEIQGTLEPVTYSQKYGDAIYQKQGFRVARVMMCKAVAEK